jgi:hypothetical protein
VEANDKIKICRQFYKIAIKEAKHNWEVRIITKKVKTLMKDFYLSIKTIILEIGKKFF